MCFPGKLWAAMWEVYEGRLNKERIPMVFEARKPGSEFDSYFDYKRYRGRLVLDGNRDFSHMFNMNPAGGQEVSDSTDESDSESW